MVSRNDETAKGEPLEQEMIIDGQRVRYTQEEIPVERLMLDPKNPRLHYLVASELGAGPVTDEKLHDILWGKDYVKALADSIEKNGGVLEPIYVMRDGKVIEGNCRTVGLREVMKRLPEDARFKKIRAFLFSKDLTDVQLAVLLSGMHVGGKTPWDAFEQARYVKSLHELHGKTYDWIAAHLRLRRANIKKMMDAFGLMQRYLDKYPDPKSVKRFTMFMEAAKKKSLLNRFGDPDFEARFHRWIEDGRITNDRQVRKLDEILDNPDAEAALEAKGFEAAYRVLTAADPTLASDLFASLAQTTRRLEKAPLDEIRQVKHGDVERIRILNELNSALQHFAEEAEIEL